MRKLKPLVCVGVYVCAPDCLRFSGQTMVSQNFSYSASSWFGHNIELCLQSIRGLAQFLKGDHC